MPRGVDRSSALRRHLAAAVARRARSLGGALGRVKTRPSASVSRILARRASRAMHATLSKKSGPYRPSARHSSASCSADRQSFSRHCDGERERVSSRLKISRNTGRTHQRVKLERLDEGRRFAGRSIVLFDERQARLQQPNVSDSLALGAESRLHRLNQGRLPLRTLQRENIHIKRRAGDRL